LCYYFFIGKSCLFFKARGLRILCRGPNAEHRPMIKKLIDQCCGSPAQGIFSRAAYFFSTVDTCFLAAGTLAVFISGGFPGLLRYVLVTVEVLVLFKLADFHPWFMLCSPVYLFFLFQSPLLDAGLFIQLIIVNLIILAVFQALFTSIPAAAAARDKTVVWRILRNSVLTVSRTTRSLPVTVFFSVVYASALMAQPELTTPQGIRFWIAAAVCALVSRYFLAQSFRSMVMRPKRERAVTQRVVILNIGGCRLDRFQEAGLPFLVSLKEKAAFFPKGIQTVYRALTNPAFASMLTGAVPGVHGVTGNSPAQSIRVEALPDVVPAKLYGGSHLQHLSKPTWNTRTVPLPVRGPAATDDLVLDWLREDLAAADGTKLFVADLRGADFAGHAYGSESPEYGTALKRMDEQLRTFFEWMREKGQDQGTVAIVCSDHGMFRADQGYLLFPSEKYVPFLMTGPGIRKGCEMEEDASIADIALTVSYLLGAPYTAAAHGRVFVEGMEKPSGMA